MSEYRSFNIVVNKTHAISNNTFKISFKGGGIKIGPGSEMCLAVSTIPYSWFNISSVYNNNKLDFYWPTASATYSKITLTIPDGYYTTTTLNNYLQSQFVSNGYYLIDNTGNFVYYFSVLYNTTYYANQIIALPVPISLPSGWTQPTGFAGFPTVARCPYIDILSTYKISDFLGFNTGSYPGSRTTAYSINSNITPIGSYVNSVIIHCDLINNDLLNPPTILDMIPITSSFGSNIYTNNNSQKWVTLKEGNYTNLTIFLTDENFTMLNALDNNSSFILFIRMKK